MHIEALFRYRQHRHEGGTFSFAPHDIDMDAIRAGRHEPELRGVQVWLSRHRLRDIRRGRPFQADVPPQRTDVHLLYPFSLGDPHRDLGEPRYDPRRADDDTHAIWARHPFEVGVGSTDVSRRNGRAGQERGDERVSPRPSPSAVAHWSLPPDPSHPVAPQQTDRGRDDGHDRGHDSGTGGYRVAKELVLPRSRRAVVVPLVGREKKISGGG